MDKKRKIKKSERIIVTNSESIWFGKKGIVVQVTPKDIVAQMDEAIMECSLSPFSFNEVETIDK